LVINILHVIKLRIFEIKTTKCAIKNLEAFLMIKYVQPDKLDNFISKIPWLVIAFILLIGFIVFLFICFRLEKPVE